MRQTIFAWVIFNLAFKYLDLGLRHCSPQNDDDDDEGNINETKNRCICMVFHVRWIFSAQIESLGVSHVLYTSGEWIKRTGLSHNCL